MKTATQLYKCSSRSGKPAHAGITQRSATGAHLPSRRPASHDGPAAPTIESEVPVLMDAPRLNPAQQALRQAAAHSDGIPRVLHIDRDADSAQALADLLMPEVLMVHAATLSEARRMLETGIYSLVVIDTALPDGDGAMLLPSLSNTPLLVYSTRQPDARFTSLTFLPKPWSTPRQLWSAISGLLGMPSTLTAGD